MIPATVCFCPITPRTLRQSASSLVLAAVVLTTAPARADNLDAALLKHAPEVMGYLQQHHCRNVGVLKFRVHKAGHPVSFKAGTITDNMVERLENALIAVNPAATPVGVIHNADHIAAARKLPRYDNPAGQRALFAQKYPLAWGNTQVTPDLMLTGIVSVRADLKSATVQIEAFGPDSAKQDKVVAFAVATDRSLLTDLNESFKISSRNLKRKTRAIELDEEAVASTTDGSSKPPGQTTTDPSTATTTADTRPGADSLLYYEIRYDGQPQAVTSDPSNPQEFVVPEPRQNQAVSFIVKSLAPERIGLVLMVNGKSTLYEEEGDPSHCKAWVLDPGKTYGIDGFQVDNSTRKPFRVLSDEESAASTYGPNTGLIQFHIFRSGGSGATDTTVVDKGPTDDPASQAANISLRGLQHEKAGKSRSLADLKKVVQAHAHTSNRRKRGLIMGSDNTVAGSIENAEVQNQILVQSIAVRYYKPKGQ
jgi:hypothetical protein